MEKSASLCSDTEYTLKRLVRGLGSSRESARQGFAACLADLLKTIAKIDLQYVLVILDEHTKVTGSMKGQEERDMLFGQLFGYLAVLRSNRVNDTKIVSDLIERSLLLHSKKGWIKEVTTEAILILVSTIDSTHVKNIIIPKLKDLLSPALGDMAAWQLMLAIGLRNYGALYPQLIKDIVTILPEPQIVSPETIEIMAPTLAAATAGFPKLHRVWPYIMSAIFQMDSERRLPVHR